jgi:hypothetical protein
MPARQCVSDGLIVLGVDAVGVHPLVYLCMVTDVQAACNANKYSV